MITIVRATCTCTACPSQWDAWADDGQYYYLRYRGGHGSVRKYASPDEQGNGEVIAEFDHGDSLDGYIELPEFAALAGLVLAPGLVVGGYAQHLEDQLREYGIFAIDGDEP